MGFENSEVSLLITDDKEIRELNSQYRHKDKATDVLSFPLEEKPDINAMHLGDIVISLDTLEAQAESFGVTKRDEFYRLLIHGLLHLLGYDHEDVSKEEALRMQKKEAELFSEFVSD